MSDVLAISILVDSTQPWTAKDYSQNGQWLDQECEESSFEQGGFMIRLFRTR
jgi:hypothetical protein